MIKLIKLFKNFLNHLFLDIKQTFEKESRKGGHFVFDCVGLSGYKRQKINPKRSESNIDSPHWIKTKKQQQILSVRITNAFNTLLH